MRLFFALDIASEIRKALTTYIDSLRRVPNVRFMPPESYHITLKFLGEVKDVEGVKAAAASVESGRFSVSIRDVGFFPDPKSPRIFWAGIHANDRLPQLATRLEEALAPAGFPREERPFRPHLTLARNGSGNPNRKTGQPAETGFRALVYLTEKNPAPEFGTMTASEFFLYESKLSPRGAQYTKLARFSLS